jgi:sterol desaturase/sphingolipid hydroxylase (fatty acid hydroxylase superfamily)
VTAGLQDFGRASLEAALEPASRISPYYWLPTLLVAFAVTRALEPGNRGAFLGGLFPRRDGAHRSHLVDLVLMLIGFVVQATGVMSFAWLTALFAVIVIDALTSTGLPRLGASGPWVAASVTIITAVTADFCTYWVHRLHHRFAVLWPFHEVHHSAEVMSPATFYRKHPVYDALHNVFTAVLGGALQGLIIALFVGKPSGWLIGNANAFYVLFNLTGSNLRHSHVWVSYGPRLSKWLVSPAMHQIHHSRAPRHRDMNYGEVLAVWDRMFGTLYVPSEREALDFGLSDEDGNALPQPYDGVLAALFGPFRASAAAVSSALRRKAP